MWLSLGPELPIALSPEPPPPLNPLLPRIPNCLPSGDFNGCLGGDPAVQLRGCRIRVGEQKNSGADELTGRATERKQAAPRTELKTVALLMVDSFELISGAGGGLT
mmetsp:Transcript_33687/g.52415  ORF Transcript_33687/g.52415 Transcript_33687/m.52415 type:complete len:106 (-) Transcript_33687:24-341(-)